MAMLDLQAWANKDESDGAHAGLSKNLEKYGLLDAAKHLKAAMATPATDALSKVDRDMSMAIEQAINTREAYAGALNEAGNSLHDTSMTDRAWQLECQAVALTDRELPRHRPEHKLPPGQQQI